MKIFKKISKFVPFVAILALISQMFIGVMPAMALPVFGVYGVTPNYGDSTNYSPTITAHVNDTTNITTCEYRWETADSSTNVTFLSTWLPGTFIPDTAGILTSGTCTSPIINVTPSANTYYFGGETRANDLFGIPVSTTSTVGTMQLLALVSDLVPQATIGSIITNNNPLPTFSGTINDPTAVITVHIWSDSLGSIEYSIFDGVNNGNGTWTAQMPDTLPDGTYVSVADAQNSNPVGTSETFTFGSFIVDTVAPTAKVAYSPSGLTNQDVVATITPSETVTGALTHTFTANGSCIPSTLPT